MKMREIDIRPFEPEDLDKIEIRPFDSEWLDKTDIINGYAVLSEMGSAYTGLYDGRIIFCGGIRDMWEGVGEVWSIGDRHMAKSFAREMFEWQYELIKTEVHMHNYHRLQAHVMKKWKGACKYMERLGFFSEALLHKYGPVGEDYILYARLS